MAGSQLKRALRFGLWAAGGIFALAILCALGAVGYNAYADARDRKRFAPPGQRIEVAGRKLHLHCTGPLGRYGQPTVVLDSGWAMPALGWTLVQPELAKRVRVCSYDRAGMGHSDADATKSPRPSAQLAQELHTLLEYGGVQPPYLLVGHSHGGFLVRRFFDRYPKDVAGAVLVDSSSEFMDEQFLGKDWQRKGQQELASAHDQAWQLRAIMALGILRWQLRKSSQSMPFSVEPAVLDEMIFLLNQPKWYGAALAELDGIPHTIVELKKKGGLGELPLIVLTAGKFTPKMKTTEEEAQKWNRVWVHELQPQLAHLSTRGRQVIADSGHLIPFEAPQSVVKAVFEVLDEAIALRAQEVF